MNVLYTYLAGLKRKQESQLLVSFGSLCVFVCFTVAYIVHNGLDDIDYINSAKFLCCSS